jgi:hypothetical protein
MESLFELATLPASPFYPLRQLPCLKKQLPILTRNLNYAYKLLNQFEPLIQFIPKKCGECREALLREGRVPRELSAAPLY